MNVGYLECLSQLTLVGDVSRDAFQGTSSCNGTWFINLTHSNDIAC